MTIYPTTPETPVSRAGVELMKAREDTARKIIETLVLGDKAGLLPTDWTSARCQHCRERGDHAFPFQHTFDCVIRRGREWLNPAATRQRAASESEPLVVSVAIHEAEG